MAHNRIQYTIVLTVLGGGCGVAMRDSSNNSLELAIRDWMGRYAKSRWKLRSSELIKCQVRRPDGDGTPVDAHSTARRRPSLGKGRSSLQSFVMGSSTGSYVWTAMPNRFPYATGMRCADRCAARTIWSSACLGSRRPAGGLERFVGLFSPAALRAT